LVNDVISIAKDLIKIPSVCGEESRIAHFIADWLEKNGLAAQILEVKPNRPDVIAVLKGPKPGPRLLFNGHMDTVEAGPGWTHDPLGCEVEEGRMYGRGTFDMKSGLACLLWVAAKCSEEGLPRKGELVVTAVVDEEAIDWGTYALVEKGITNGVDFAMISESTNLEVVTAHRGRAVFEVEIRGKAAHSQWPEHGVNAIEKAAVLVNSIERLRGPDHPRMGRSTVNIAKIEGGQEEVMLVPDRCRLVIERCLVPGYSSKAALDDLRRLATELGIDAEAKLVDRETPFCEPFEIPEDDPHVRLVVEAAAKVLGKVPEVTFHPGPCDSCIMVNQGKVTTIEFGPSGARLHEPDEYVEIESVKKTAAVYHEVVKAALS
jgi:acetylornithine deacetylase/succinyl-diaminopimelate desuccinylase family protein